MTTGQFPSYISKYFWGDDLKQLDLKKNQKYIIQTILERGDSKAVKWLFSALSQNEVKKTLPVLRLSKKSSNFWHLYFS